MDNVSPDAISSPEHPKRRPDFAEVVHRRDPFASTFRPNAARRGLQLKLSGGMPPASTRCGLVRLENQIREDGEEGSCKALKP